MIYVSKTYARTTPESAEHGDHSETGFEYEDQPMTFKELLRELMECSHTSSSHNFSINDWFSSEASTIDYRTGEDEEISIHYSRKNPERNEKYWKLAHQWFTKGVK